ncbi:MAG: hypothetical protein LIO63_07805, partial [Akkermansia sp.]|nr:hypothetical protein [Akkermansia sp.]
MRTHAVDIFLAMTCCQLGVVSASIKSDNIEAEAYRLSIEAYRQAVKIEQRILETASRLAGRGEGKSYAEEKQIVREGCELVDDIAAQESDPEVVYLVAKGLYDEKVRDAIDGQILFHARECFAVRLGELGTREAYELFLRLKRQYGRDGRERLKFDYWEKQLFGKYVDEKSTAYRQADKIEQRVVKTASRLAGRGEGKSYDEEKQIVREGCELVDDIAA